MWIRKLFPFVYVLGAMGTVSGCATRQTDGGQGATAMSARVLAVNVISVAPASQQAVAKLQLELVEKVKSGWPGFLSQKTLVSTDGTKVTTVEEYASMESLLAIVKAPGLLEYRQKILAAGGKMDASAYRHPDGAAAGREASR